MSTKSQTDPKIKENTEISDSPKKVLPQNSGVIFLGIIGTIIWKLFLITLITVIGAGITCGGNVMLSWWGSSWFVEILLCFIWAIYFVVARKKGEKIPLFLKIVSIILIIIIIILGVTGPHNFNI